MLLHVGGQQRDAMPRPDSLARRPASHRHGRADAPAAPTSPPGGPCSWHQTRPRPGDTAIIRRRIRPEPGVFPHEAHHMRAQQPEEERTPAPRSAAAAPHCPHLSGQCRRSHQGHAGCPAVRNGSDPDRPAARSGPGCCTPGCTSGSETHLLTRLQDMPLRGLVPAKPASIR